MQAPSTSATSSADPSNGLDRPPPSSFDEAFSDQTAPYRRFQNSYSFSQSYRNPIRSKGSCIRSVVAIMVSLIVVMSSLLLVIWLIRSPRFPQVRVDSFSVTNRSTSAQSITGIWHIGLVFFNENNKMAATYNHVHSSIFYKSKYLTGTSVSPFKEIEGHEVAIHVTLSLVSSYVDGWIAHDITEDTARGEVKFDIEVVAKIAFKEGAWRIRTKWLRVYCSDVPIKILGTSGTLVDGAVYCKDS